MEAHFHVSHDTDDEAPCKEKKDDVDNPEIADFEKAISLTGYGRYNYLLLLTAMIGTIGNQCDLNGVSFLLPSAECDLHLTQIDKGLLNAVIYIGMISSAFMWGFLSDTFGRRIPITVAYFIDAILNICASFAQSFWVLLVIKFCAGFVICGPVSMVKAYLAEFHGQSSRAKVMMCTGVFASSANVIIPGLAWIIIPQPWSWELFDGYIVYNSWRVYVLVCAMPSLLAAVLMNFFLESPKFLMAVGRNEQAIDVLRSVYRINTGKDAQTYPIKVLIQRKMSIIEETPCKMIASKSILSILKQGFGKIKPLFKLPLLPKILLVFVIQFGTLFGLSTLRQWLPQIFATMQEYTHIQESMNVSIAGVSLCDMLEYTQFQNTTEVRQEGTGHCSVAMAENTVYINSLIIGGSSIVGFLCAGACVNYLGKKTLTISTFLCAGVCCTAIYWSRSTTLTVTLAAMFIAIVSVAAIGIISIVVEIFPTSLRNTSVSLSMMCGQIGAMIGNFCFPILLEIDCIVPFVLIGSLIIGCGLLSFLLPTSGSTKKR